MQQRALEVARAPARCCALAVGLTAARAQRSRLGPPELRELLNHMEVVLQETSLQNIELRVRPCAGFPAHRAGRLSDQGDKEALGKELARLAEDCALAAVKLLFLRGVTSACTVRLRQVADEEGQKTLERLVVQLDEVRAAPWARRPPPRRHAARQHPLSAFVRSARRSATSCSSRWTTPSACCASWRRSGPGNERPLISNERWDSWRHRGTARSAQLSRQSGKTLD
jgi:hypothetical protein